MYWIKSSENSWDCMFLSVSLSLGSWERNVIWKRCLSWFFFLKFSFFVTSLAPEIISLPRCTDANLREQTEPLRCALPNSTCFVEAQVCRKLKQPRLHHHYNENKKKGNLRKTQEIITSSAYNFQVAHSPSGTVGLCHEQETHKIKEQARPCTSFVYAWTHC